MAKYKDLTNQEQFLDELDNRGVTQGDEVNGIELNDDTKSQEMVDMLNYLDEQEQAKEEASEEADTGSEEYIYYWLKLKSFISEDEALPAGLYAFEEKNDRLDGSPQRAVEKFDDGISERALVDIGEERGMEFHASDDVDEEELLDTLLDDTITA